MTLILEPGRVIVGNAGILVTEVVYTKTTPSKEFVIVDAAMNDLVRPALYDSFHAVGEVKRHGRPVRNVDVVGPICESSDFLARGREIPGVEAGELLAVFSAGAYGFTMSSNYNSRPRAAEVLVDGEVAVLARKRETYEDLIAWSATASNSGKRPRGSSRGPARYFSRGKKPLTDPRGEPILSFLA
jgi:diaminopimelate decarboxylase